MDSPSKKRTPAADTPDSPLTVFRRIQAERGRGSLSNTNQLQWLHHEPYESQDLRPKGAANARTPNLQLDLAEKIIVLDRRNPRCSVKLPCERDNQSVN